MQLESIITKLLYSFLYQTVAGFSLHSLSAISILPVLASVLQDGNMAPRLQSKSEQLRAVESSNDKGEASSR